MTETVTCLGTDREGMRPESNCRERIYRIRRARIKDLDAVAGIEQRSIPDPWSRKGFADALARPEVIFLVAEVSDGACCGIAGYCVMYTSADEGEIPTIAVDSGSRRRGVAAELLETAFAEGAKRGVRRVYLEVRRSNAGALALYQNRGFSVDGSRPKFYRNPVEDAVVMHRELDALGKDSDCV